MKAEYTEGSAFLHSTVTAPLRHLNDFYAEAFGRLVGCRHGLRARWLAPLDVHLQLPTLTRHFFCIFIHAIASHEIPVQLIVVDHFPTSVALLTYNFSHILPNDADSGARHSISPLGFLALALDRTGH